MEGRLVRSSQPGKVNKARKSPLHKQMGVCMAYQGRGGERL
jgi:hypothetical protein